jgi:hypothetical protein
LVGLVVPVQEIFDALAAPVSPVQNIIFLTAHFFTLLVPIAQQTGQEVVMCRLSVSLVPYTMFISEYSIW